MSLAAGTLMSRPGRPGDDELLRPLLRWRPHLKQLPDGQQAEEVCCHQVALVYSHQARLAVRLQRGLRGGWVRGSGDGGQATCNDAVAWRHACE